MSIYGMERHGDLPRWLTVIGVALLLALPMWLTGCPRGHDILHHLIFSHHFTEQFWQGELYPRWLQNMNGGLGSPTFFFYAPLPFWATALLSAPLWIDGNSTYPLVLSATLALMASGLTAYLWLKSLTTPRHAMICALIYMVLPYHLLVDLYMRFAFAEFWSFVWMPLILYHSRHLALGARSTLALALCLALLIMTHLPSFLLFLPVVLGHALFVPSRRYRLCSLLHHMLACALGAGLAALYWLPALTTQHYVSMPSMYTGFLFYANSFLDSWPNFQHGWSFRRYLSFISVLTAVLGLCAWLVRQPHPALQREHRFWLLVLLGALVMMWPISKPLWDWLPIVQKVQFPWRFGGVLTLAATALLALATTDQKGKLNPKIATCGWGVLALLLLSELLVGIRPMLLQPVSAEISRQSLSTSRSPLEYRPRWVPPELFSFQQIGRFASNTPKIASSQSDTRWKLLSWQARSITLQVSAPTATQLTLHQFYYPGWQANLEDGTPLPLNPTESGLLQLEVPAGSYGVSLMLARLPQEQAGIWLSALALLVALLWGYRERRSRAAARAHPLGSHSAGSTPD
ncbi:MAG: 6-pyruvoyl-tetrahydropterin synthase-related protein [Aeromonadaceae bacterium]